MSDIRYCTYCNTYTQRYGKERGYKCKKCGKADRASFVPMFSRDDLTALAKQIGIDVKGNRPKRKRRKRKGKK